MAGLMGDFLNIPVQEIFSWRGVDHRGIGFSLKKYWSIFMVSNRSLARILLNLMNFFADFYVSGSTFIRKISIINIIHAIWMTEFI